MALVPRLRCDGGEVRVMLGAGRFETESLVCVGRAFESALEWLCPSCGEKGIDCMLGRSIEPLGVPAVLYVLSAEWCVTGLLDAAAGLGDPFEP